MQIQHSRTYEIVSMRFSTSVEQDQAILARIKTRDITKQMVRVKSSNIWSYCMDIRDFKDKTGTLYIQFKGKNGGPDDIYRYHDVPIIIWKKLSSAPSKGHAFWKYVRDNFTYEKLTGDKKTKLKNGVNSKY